MKFTAKQERFVNEYLQDFNGTQAAIRAGYSPTCARETAYKLLEKGHIKSLIDQKMDESAEILEISRLTIMRGLLDAIEMGRAQEKPLAMIRGFAELNKMCGFYEPEVKQLELSAGQAGFMKHIHDMTDGELLAVLGSELEG